MTAPRSEIPAGKVPIVECAVQSWRFLLQNGRQLAPAALIVAVVCGVLPVALGAGSAGDLRTFAVTTVAGLFFSAAVLRKAVRSEYMAPTGLAFGEDEMRLFGVLAAMTLVVAPPVALYLVLLGVVMVNHAGGIEQIPNPQTDPEGANRFLAEAMSSPAGSLVAIIGLVGVLVLVVVSARLVMVNAATIGERKMVFFQTWSWSKGNVLRVLAAVILTALPAYFATTIVSSILGGLFPATAISVAIREMLVYLVAVFGSVPPAALGAQLYKGLRPTDFVAK